MKTVALIVGHKVTSKGAVNEKTGLTEFGFNDVLAGIVADALIAQNTGVQPVIIYRDTYEGLPSKVNATKADIAVSLHCNAFNTKASGSEVLYFAGSENGQKLASLFQKEVVAALQTKDRGIKPIAHDYMGSKGDRGGWLVQKTAMPCVIVEPFFIDNDTELNNANSKHSELVQAYVNAIVSYLN